MQIIVASLKTQFEELSGGINNVDWVWVENNFSFEDFPNANAFFVLNENAANINSETTQLVFLNSVTTTLAQLNLPQNVLRINGWNTFLQRNTWEVVGDVTSKAKEVLLAINKKIITVKDTPGLVAAKVIAMIINEAFFALGDDVSTKQEIDTAMKLGTNYPYGPFEWTEKIGLKNVYKLLQKLSETDSRYQPAPMMIDLIENK